ncbi:hypothetical protein BDM02DRAFT_1779751 [Thelephora ganbajun]|uniref:Uncharacterized protein n=1 Tax=Thelephora ganbajun TaxID=370292 RepID=A0ACB6ZJJ0_THEGA|nr:hypothetical protein BDM02DRAFT_1779751 [Thelephora ganbajun]
MRISCWHPWLSEMIPRKPLTASRCVPYRSYEQGKVLAAVWSLKPLFDLVVLLLTIRKSSKFKRTPRPILVDILIADGIVYFAASLVLNTLSICFCLWAPPYLRAVGAPLTAAICSIMASRMTLNLRDPDIITHPMESLLDPIPESEHVSTILSLGHPSYAESLRRYRSEVGSSVITLRRIGTQGVD